MNDFNHHHIMKFPLSLTQELWHMFLTLSFESKLKNTANANKQQSKPVYSAAYNTKLLYEKRLTAPLILILMKIEIKALKYSR